MASSREFVDYAVGQMQGAGEIRARPMFGEWGLYGDGVFFAVICDNALLSSPRPRGGRRSPSCPWPRPTTERKTICWWRSWRSGRRSAA